LSKYIPDTFQTRSNELTERFADPEDEYYIQDTDSASIVSELEDRDHYREVNVFWVPEAARWENLRTQAKQPDIGKRIDDALTLSGRFEFAPQIFEAFLNMDCYKSAI
jgi:type I restriction enzyme M protein